MAKLSKEIIYAGKKDETFDNRVKIDFEVNVSKDGWFYTNLSDQWIAFFESNNVKLERNARTKKVGYIAEKTLADLLKKVQKLADEAVSRELISEELVIKYAIKTSCSYFLDKDGGIAPNASREWTNLKERAPDDWKEGTVSQHASSPRPFGIEVYAKPFWKREYRYRSGSVKIEFARLGQYDTKEVDKSWYYLRWLEAVPAIIPPDETKIQEIEYSEAVAKFFVDMLKAICTLNENIKDFINPVAIKQIAESGGRLIGNY